MTFGSALVRGDAVIVPPLPSSQPPFCTLVDTFDTPAGPFIPVDRDIFVDFPARTAVPSGFGWVGGGTSYIFFDNSGLGDPSCLYEYAGGVGHFLVSAPQPKGTYVETFELLDGLPFTSPAFAVNARFRVAQMDVGADGITAFEFVVGGPAAAFAMWEIEGGRGTSKAHIRIRNENMPFNDVRVDEIAFDFDNAKWYTLRFQGSLGSYLRARWWADGEAEPSSWMVNADISDRPSWTPESFNFAWFAPQYPFSAPAGATELFWDDLGICDIGTVSNPFDDFDRVRASDWDHSTDGHLWTQDSFPTATQRMSVNGTEGVLNIDSGVLDEIDMKTTLPFVGGSFTLDAEFRIPAIASTAHQPVISVNMEPSPPGGGNALYFDLWLADNSTDGHCSVSIQPIGSSGDIPFVFQAGTYRVKFEYDRSVPVGRLRVWLSSDPEPGLWLIQQSGTVPEDVATIIVSWSNFQFAGDATVYWNYIHFS